MTIAVGGVPPGRRLLQVDPERGGAVRVAAPPPRRRRAGSAGRHQVGVDVVVGHRAVLVRPGHAVDAELARRCRGGPASATAGRSRPAAPARCRARSRGRRWRRRSGSTASAMSALMWNAAVPAGQYPEHSWPRMVRHGNAAPCSPSCSARSLASGRICCRQRSASAAASGAVYASIGSTKRLGVPERVPVVAGPGQALRRDRPALGAGAGLQHVEQRRTARACWSSRVAVDLDVRDVPELVEVVALLGDQTVPAGVAGGGERGADLVGAGRAAVRRDDQP